MGEYNVLSYRLTIDDALTVDICINYCLDQQRDVYVRYAGVEAGNECICGTEGDKYNQCGERADADCNITCPGDNSQMCGGDKAIAVYDCKYDVI